MNELKGLALNNPLNIRKTNERWIGESLSPRSTVWMDYEDPKWCYREAHRIIMRHYVEGKTLVRDIVDRWAPAADGNAPEVYALNVCRRIGISVTTPIDLPKDMPLLLHAMTIQEIGAYPWDNDNAILEGIELDTPPQQEPSAPPAPRQDLESGERLKWEEPLPTAVPQGEFTKEEMPPAPPTPALVLGNLSSKVLLAPLVGAAAGWLASKGLVLTPDQTESLMSLAAMGLTWVAHYWNEHTQAKLAFLNGEAK